MTPDAKATWNAGDIVEIGREGPHVDMAGQARSLFPMLLVADLEKARGFYGGQLGGIETYRFPTDGTPEFVVLRFGDSHVGLSCGSDIGQIHGVRSRPAQGHRIELCVYVDDVDETIDMLRRSGTPVIVEPSNQTWGERIAYVADPDGNLLMLAR